MVVDGVGGIFEEWILGDLFEERWIVKGDAGESEVRKI